MTSVLTYNHDQINLKQIHSDDIYLSQEKTIYGNTKLNLNCAEINLGTSDS
jgi:hypothetical protein